MLRLAIVEDETPYAHSLAALLERYAQSRGVALRWETFADGFAFLEQYSGGYDGVFMDIVLPNMDGLETARRLRQVDEEVPLVFVTTVAQYAIRGYEVGAMGFMVKPVVYQELELMLGRILRQARRRQAAAWPITQGGVVRMLEVRSVYYVEVYDHSLIVHAQQGRFTVYGQLKALESDPRFATFAKCSPSHLVNCLWVTEVRGDTLTAGGEVLPLSRRRRKAFLEQMTRVLGGNLG